MCVCACFRTSACTFAVCCNPIQNKYCRRKELMASERKPREKLCASAFHPPKPEQKGTKSGRLRRPLCVRVFRVLEGWNALAHNFSRVSARWPLILSDDNTSPFLNCPALTNSFFLRCERNAIARAVTRIYLSSVCAYVTSFAVHFLHVI